jgi:cytosine deaminase
MELAFKQAKLAFTQNEIPVGCVVIDSNAKIISSQYNKTHNSKKILQHAEILAINESCEIKNQKFLEDCDLYVTLEPCLMCFSAIALARIKRVYYGIGDKKFGVFSSGMLGDFNNKQYNKAQYYGGFMEDEIAQLMKSFFQSKRI